MASGPSAGMLGALGLLVALVAALPAMDASAQTVLARVIDAETGGPVEGALAHLIDLEGRLVRNVLSDRLGRAIFVGVPVGAYRIRAEMIGRATYESGPLDVPADATVQTELRLTSSAIALEGIQVEAEERCRIRPEEGLVIGRVWDEARKALEAASFTERAGVYRYRTQLYERDLDRNARLVVAERQSSREAYMRVPFESRPVDDLLDNGFVQDDREGGRLYFAPDAHVLLSDRFLDAHCLRLEAGEDEAEGLIGVGFEPVGERRRQVAGIAGTLWLDPTTSELEWLEFRYLDALPDVASDLIGGRVTFRRMPEGTWIVPEWWIRMPRLVREAGGSGEIRTRIDGYRQSGGRVLEVESTAGQALLRARTGAIEGFVQDSLGVLPVEGVRVGIVGSNQQVFTDAEGRFRLTGLGGGEYAIRFVDDRLEELGLEAEPITREVRLGEVTSVFYRMPALSELLFAACRAETPPEGTSVLTGRVTDRRTGGPLAGVSVRVRWEDFRMTPPGDPERRITGADVHGLETITGDDGFYRFCGAPEERLLMVVVARDGRESPPDTIRIPPFAGARVHSLEWGP